MSDELSPPIKRSGKNGATKLNIQRSMGVSPMYLHQRKDSPVRAIIVSISLLFCACAAAQTSMTIKTALAHSRVLSGLEIQVENDRVTVMPGVCRVGDATVQVAEPTAFKIDPVEQIAVNDEEYELTTDVPDRWIKGTHLKG